MKNQFTNTFAQVTGIKTEYGQLRGDDDKRLLVRATISFPIAAGEEDKIGELYRLMKFYGISVSLETDQQAIPFDSTKKADKEKAPPVMAALKDKSKDQPLVPASVAPVKAGAK